MSDLLQDVRTSRTPAFEVFDGGKRYKIFANGKVEVEDNSPLPGFVTINRLPFLDKEAA